MKLAFKTLGIRYNSKPYATYRTLEKLKIGIIHIISNHMPNLLIETIKSGWSAKLLKKPKSPFITLTSLITYYFHKVWMVSQVIKKPKRSTSSLFLFYHL